jgi:hypothetical protein
MKRYAPLRFRPAFGLAAAALTAATMVLTVGVPAALSPEGPAATSLAASRDAPAAIEVTIFPASVDVIGVRGESVASTPGREAKTPSSVRS